MYMDATDVIINLIIFSLLALYVLNRFREADKVAKLAGLKYVYPEECCNCGIRPGTEKYLVRFRGKTEYGATTAIEAIMKLTLPDINLEASVPICTDCKKKLQGLFPKIQAPAFFDEEGDLLFRNDVYDKKFGEFNALPIALNPPARKLTQMWTTIWVVHLISIVVLFVIDWPGALLFQIGLMVGTVGAQKRKKWGVYIFGGSVILGTFLSFFGVPFVGFWGIVYLAIFIYLWRDGEFS